MFNRLCAFSKQAIYIGLLTACVLTIYISPTSSQVLSEVWGQGKPILKLLFSASKCSLNSSPVIYKTGIS